MRIALKSNFRDYMDFAFDPPELADVVFERQGGNSGPPKREQFRILEAAGFKVPPHGLVADVLGEWWEDERRWVKGVVAYTDESAHCTQGKEVWHKGSRAIQLYHVMNWHEVNGDAWRRLTTTYCSAYLGDNHLIPAGPSHSLRRLQVGPHVFHIMYTSDGSWMSNDGDGDIELVGYELNAGFHEVVKQPLWAVDFVCGKAADYAVDFNTAPGVRGSGVEKVLDGVDFVEALRSFYEEYPSEEVS